MAKSAGEGPSRGKRALPTTIEPMLLKSADPFSSDEYLFEIKWDGTRAIALVEGDDYRLHNRRLTSMKPTFPDLSFLQELPAGTVLDGEIVVFVEGKPQFIETMNRVHAQGARRIQELTHLLPATYAVFDLLWDGGESLYDVPLHERRERLTEVLGAIDHPHLALSDGIVGQGEAYYDVACEQELEGIVAKRLNSKYRPGYRTESWLKIKRSQTVYCAIIGYVMSEKSVGDIRSLIIAAEEDGELRCVGKVGSGLTAAARADLLERLRKIPRSESVVPCRHAGEWVEPVMFCEVAYLERTRSGELRGPVFRGLAE